MQLYRTLASSLPRNSDTARVATVGVFDGLHLGHQEILSQLVSVAESRNCAAIVCSFEPMPEEYFVPSNPPPRLTCFRERFELLDAFGIDEMFCPQFSAIRELTSELFIEQLLVKGLNVAHVVVGDDFRFGTGRRGTIDDLERGGRKFGFDVCTVPPVFWRDQRISSTAIRRALQQGDLDSAKSMLGRDYAMSGRVVYGLAFGKQLGFPTANVNLKRRLAPVDGIFAVRVSGLGERKLDGVASVGSRPMVGGGKTLLEVFIFDFDREIYGEYITVHFVKRLREERTFPDLDLMKEQMHVDVREAQAALAG